MATTRLSGLALIISAAATLLGGCGGSQPITDARSTALQPATHFRGWSLPVYLGLVGSINAKQGSGQFIISGMGGYASGGGTFTMTRKQNKKCSSG
jgi:hypothetical protein